MLERVGAGGRRRHCVIVDGLSGADREPDRIGIGTGTGTGTGGIAHPDS